MAGCRINIIFGEMLRVLSEANCVEPVRIDRVAAPTLDQTIAHSWLDGISICPVAGLPLGALAKAEPALREISHRHAPSVASLIGHLRSSTFRLSATAMSMSLKYWEGEQHTAIMRTMPGLQKWVQNHVISAPGETASFE